MGLVGLLQYDWSERNISGWGFHGERGYEQERGIPEGKGGKEEPGKSDYLQALPSWEQNYIWEAVDVLFWQDYIYPQILAIIL